MRDQSIDVVCVGSGPRIQRWKAAISLAKLGLPSAAVVLSLLSSLSFAGTAITRVEAKLLWRDVCTGANFYDTESQAVQASIVCLQASSPPTASQVTTYYGDFACPSSVTTNGQAVYRCSHVQYTFPNQPSASQLAATRSAYIAGSKCPDGFSGRQTAIDSDGNTVSYCTLVKTTFDPPSKGCPWVGDPIEPTSGITKETELDYRAPNGLLEFVRTYRSDIGQFTSAVSSSGFFDYSSPPLAPMGRCVDGRYNTMHTDASGNAIKASYCFPVMPIGSVDKPHALLWDETGRQIDFDMSSGTPVPNADINDRAVKTTDASGNVQWRLTREDNTVELYAANGALLSRTTADGKTVTYSYSTASTPTTIAPTSGLLIAQTDPFGRALSFRYNSTGLMTQMTDPAGRAYNYTYDTTSAECAAGTCNRVVQVQFPDQFARQYLYNESSLIGASTPPSPPLLTGINEVWPATSNSARQTVRASTFGYDSSNLSILTQRAGGLDQYTVTSRSSGSVTVKDPLGAQRTTAYQTLFGATYPSSRSQPAGSGCSASTTSWNYDAHGNAASTLDVNAHRTCSAYDLSRNLETTRVAGLSNTATCSTYTATGTILPAGSRKVSMQWHPEWRLEVKRAEPGTIITSVYNGQPDPFNANAMASCAPSTALLPDGKPIAVLCTQVEQATTDMDGSQGLSASLQSAVPNRVRSWTYNAYGQVLTETDPLNNTTTYTYYSDTSFTGADPNAVGHTLGDLQSVTNAKGQMTRYTKYDKHGNVLESVDANGVTTTNTYDLRQRLLSVSVGGQSTSYTYDATGQLLNVTAPDGSSIGFTYDGAHRLTGVSDSQGNSISYTLDAIGNRTQEQAKDSSGTLSRQITRVIDSLNRLQKVTVGTAQ
ncbi:RHS repeat domain-containing protein [Ralstonia pseudosolanacearum]|uniref:Probable rhs-related protein n=1 Tax=Ralstonia nicotianae (strain ATCC BAA-1114 / GMI1000) TaxID=267608 RepID=Q8XSL4_RALN1|nr:RHS repeat domain-containing protein [Ralstonia pseudosolanacearum]AST29493.1 type IV secretion protein Rhs [Ralstonia pseudosolanacearum]MCQ4678153.1 RHS repeat protein [Ralstonia pseudosolanacearum]MDC6286673.1 RHS repeat protein [Ralstonia pseudosolanacearum]CAD17606.1 probable rhs-related protein [Ralstonia pseudosolanacearum GMI1000]